MAESGVADNGEDHANPSQPRPPSRDDYRSRTDPPGWITAVMMQVWQTLLSHPEKEKNASDARDRSLKRQLPPVMRPLSTDRRRSLTRAGAEIAQRGRDNGGVRFHVL